MEPFSLTGLQALKNFPIKERRTLTASDGLSLAYYSFVPENPKAALIFYHGAGFYQGALYQNFAQELANKHNIASYLFDIRGHGNSGGDRGDASSIKQVWDDITQAINLVKKYHPSIPLYLGGHSSGAGMVLNYSKYNQNPDVQGYIFIAPYLGRNSGAIKEHADSRTSFVKNVRVWVFILNALTGGYFFAHTPAVFFNFPKELLKSDPKVVTSYTATMMAATAPENPQELFAQIDKPFLLLAAQNDEQFLSDKLVEYKNLAPENISKKSQALIMPNTKHLDILLNAADSVADFMLNTHLLS